MASGLYLTLLVGPVVAVPVPKPLIDALTSVEVKVSATGRSAFQLGFTLANNSVLQTFFLLAAGSPLPVLRVILVVTFGGLPQVVFDGIVLHHEIVEDAMKGFERPDGDRRGPVLADGADGVLRATLPRNDAGPARPDDPGQVCRSSG